MRFLNQNQHKTKARLNKIKTLRQNKDPPGGCCTYGTPIDIVEFSTNCPADQGLWRVNMDRTEPKIDTPETQRRSWDVHAKRQQLLTLWKRYREADDYNRPAVK